MRNIIVSSLFFVLFLVACTSRQPQYSIGVSQCLDDAWRQKMNAEMERELLLHPEMTLSRRIAYGNNELQCAQIDSFIAEQVDLLIVSPNEAEEVKPAVTRAYRAGIPVIVADRRVSGDEWTAFIGGDNYGAGVLMARWVLKVQAETTHPLNVLEVSGLSGSTPERLRHQGLTEGLKADQRKDERIPQVHSVIGATDAYHTVLAYLQEHRNVDVIVAQNDLMAMDAAKAVRDDGAYRHVRIMGVDGIQEGLRAIADGVIECTATYPSRGDMLIATAAHILAQEPFVRDTIIPTVLVDREMAEAMLDLSAEIDHEVGTITMLKQRSDILRKEFRQQHAILWIVGVFSFMLIVLFFYVFRLYRQRKRLHEQLMETQGRLEEAMRSKLTFFTNVSHDFRTPLTLIADPLGQLEQDKGLTQEQHGLIALAHRNTQVLLRLINQVLDFRKYESGMLKAKWSKVNMNEAMREWTEAFTPLAKQRHIALSFEAPEETIEAVLDIGKTERIVFNIVANAFKFTPENGHIGVQLWRDGKNVCFSISDTGSGIPEAYKQRIFDTFFQMDATNSQGSGIGLALVRSFVTLQGGTITVADNPEGQGTTFTIQLPIGNPLTADANADYVHITSEQILTELGTEGQEEVSVSRDDDKSIMLVVDDNADIRSYLRRLFADTYTVIAAENGATGLRKAFITVPDIILCDLSMPDIDGLEVCRQLKTEQVTSHIPVLMLTARSLDEQQIEGYEHGADAYVSKPFKAEVLKAQVASLIENRKRVKSQDPSANAKAKHDLRTPEEQFVQRFTDLVKERLDDETLSVEIIADKMALSRTQLYRKIKQLTNYSPNEIIRNVRLNEARILLSTGTRSISEVAYNTGFTSPSYFTKCYAEFFGELPSARNTKNK